MIHEGLEIFCTAFRFGAGMLISVAGLAIGLAVTLIPLALIISGIEFLLEKKKK